jgi:hypothetical protein
MVIYFYAIHDETGKRIDDTSDYPMAIDFLAHDLATLCAEEVQLDHGTYYKVGDDFAGYQYFTVITEEM